MKKSISYFLFVVGLIAIAMSCNQDNKHPENESYPKQFHPNEENTPQDEFEHTDFTEALSQNAIKADNYFNQAITLFVEDKPGKSAVAIDNALYEMALQGSYIHDEAQTRLDENLTYLGSLSALVAKDELKDVDKLKHAITYARLSLAKDLLYANPSAEIVTEPATKPTTTAKNPVGKQAAITITIKDNQPHLMQVITEIKTASHHLTGKQKQEVDQLIASAEKTADQAIAGDGNAQKAFEDILAEFQAYLDTHQKEMHEMNKAIQAKIDAEQKQQAEKIQKLKKEIAAQAAKEKAFRQQQLEEKKEKGKKQK